MDPGYAIVGVGILDYDKNRFSPLRYGAITTPAGMDFNERLCLIYEELTTVIAQTKPQVLSIEKLYFNSNQKTAIAVAEARGVTLLAAKQAGLAIYEYTPLQIKQSLVGFGRAEKKQVQEMVKTILHLDAIPKPDDTADALAVAICHGHSAGSLLRGIE